MASMLSLAELLSPFSPPETHLVERLRYWKDAQPNDIAFRFLEDGESKEKVLTYAKLDERARAVGSKLVSMNMGGQRALLLFQSGLEFIEAFFGCHYAGVIPVPAFPPRRNRNMGRIDAISKDADAAVALTTFDVMDRMDQATLESTPSLQKASWVSVDKIPNELARDWVKPELSLDDIALIQYTSGSTGSPKGVVLTQRNVISNCRMISKAFQVGLNDIAISWLPLYHDMGLIGGIVNPMFMGCEVVMLSPISFLTRPIRWLQAITKYKATITGGPNFAYNLCVDRVEPSALEELDLSSWKIAFNGAEPVRADVLNRFSENFASSGFRPQAHYPCYGMAETTLFVTGGYPHLSPEIVSFVSERLENYEVVPASKDSEETTRDLVSCGRVVDGEEVLIVDQKTRKQLPDDKIGEIWVKSPSVGTGYWQKEEVSEEVFRATLADQPEGEKYLRTGDLGFFYNDELFVSGRLKDMIIVNGVNRYPQDIEATVEQCSPFLKPAGAAAFATMKDGEEILAVVCEVERKHDVDWNDVITKVRSSVTKEHELAPDTVILVRSSSIPKTSSGKIQRHACRKYFREDKLLCVAKWASWEAATASVSESATVCANSSVNTEEVSEEVQQVIAVVSEVVRQVAKERAKSLGPSTNIVVDLGLDSLERMGIASTLEEMYGGSIPTEVLQEIETITEIASAIVTHIGSQPVGQPVSTSGLKTNGKKYRRLEDLPESFYDLQQLPEFVRFRRTKNLVKKAGARNPFFSVHEGVINDCTQIDGRKLISYSSYNYLGLSGTEEVNQGAIDSVTQFGTSVSASRIVSGQKTIHVQLEKELSEYLGFEDVITFPGGHATNETVIGHLVSAGDLILHDSLAHNSIIQGAELSGARRRAFEHNNWKQLDEILSEIRTEYRRVLIAIEGLYSMDGDYPNLPEFVRVKDKHKCWLYVDEAHSFGTLGDTGRGLAEVYGLERNQVEAWMGTFSKAFASCGGFVGANKQLVEFLRYTTPGYVFAAGMPPANVGAALAALRMIKKEPERVRKLQENSSYFEKTARAAGLDTGLCQETCVVPIIVGNSLRALKLSEAMFHKGINVQPIMYPAVEEDRARLRFFQTSDHTKEQIDQTIELLVEAFREVYPEKLEETNVSEPV